MKNLLSQVSVLLVILCLSICKADTGQDNEIIRKLSDSNIEVTMKEYENLLIFFYTEKWYLYILNPF